jgi:ABC-type multidrug transport system permease subunit
MSESSAAAQTDGRALSRADAYVALCVARFREFYREPEVVFWSFAFPILLSVALGVAFRNRPVQVLPVVVVAAPDAERVASALRGGTLSVSVLDEAQAARALRMGRADLVVVPAGDGSVEYRLDPSRPESALAREKVDDALQRASGRVDPLPISDRPVSEPGGRYIDFLIPGLIGLNAMSGGMWGVGFNLVDMRIRKLLKRLVATPMRRGDFLAAQMSVRVLFVAIELTFILTFAALVFGVPVRGSIGALAVVGAAGALCFGGMGLLVASRATRIESVSGLMNLVMMPMMICSGTFFAVERFPQVAQPAIRALPLTALNDALRAVVLEGAPLSSQGWPLALLALWGGVSFALGLRLFRWS